MALDVSVSNRTAFPSIRYVGHSANHPSGDLPQGEADLMADNGSQATDSMPCLAHHRCGDDSRLAIDLTDSCTLWYTREYDTTLSAAARQTRLGPFTLPSHRAQLSCGMFHRGSLPIR